MISQPMAGLTEEQIVETRERAVAHLEEMGFEIVNTLFTDEWYSKDSMSERGVVHVPLCFFAKSVENMSSCNVVYFCKDFYKARGCKLEHEVAKAYGVDVMYENIADPYKM